MRRLPRLTGPTQAPSVAPNVLAYAFAQAENASPREKMNAERTDSHAAFLLRAAVLHSVTYIVAGLLSSMVFDYQRVFSEPVIRDYMKEYRSAGVSWGAWLQPVRGLLFGLVLLPLRDTLSAQRHGWLTLGRSFSASASSEPRPQRPLRSRATGARPSPAGEAAVKQGRRHEHGRGHHDGHLAADEHRVDRGRREERGQARSQPAVVNVRADRVGEAA